MNLNSREGLIARLRRSKEARRQFTDSHVNKAICHQLRAIRDALGWSQERLAQETGMNQNAISRLESADYGRPTITTLKRLAAALDVSLIVRFAPFSEVVDWVSGTRHVNEGLTGDSLAVKTFAAEEALGVFSARQQRYIPRKPQKPVKQELGAMLHSDIDKRAAELGYSTSPPLATKAVDATSVHSQSERLRQQRSVLAAISAIPTPASARSRL
jgi:transcriptional regulator with XRE-family HTH domain